jgi:hypothetical protein
MADGARILTRVCSWGPPTEDLLRIFSKEDLGDGGGVRLSRGTRSAGRAGPHKLKTDDVLKPFLAEQRIVFSSRLTTPPPEVWRRSRARPVAPTKLSRIVHTRNPVVREMAWRDTA